MLNFNFDALDLLHNGGMKKRKERERERERERRVEKG
jgi:hypothetical protein